MKFQNQQKGLFTFYREQQIFEEERENNKRTKRKVSPQKRKEEVTYKRLEGTFRHWGNDKSKVASPSSLSRQQKGKRQIRFKRFGESVMIINKKQASNTRHLNNKKHQIDPIDILQEQGHYIQNKCISFDALNEKPYILTHCKHQPFKRKEDHSPPSLKYYRNEGSITKLPSLAKGVHSDGHQSQRSNVNGSLLKSHQSDIFRQLRSKPVQNEPINQQKRSVSYLQFSRDYLAEIQSKRRGNLSIQQQRLLQILHRCRRYDN